jgi:prevent-host-death family protein
MKTVSAREMRTTWPKIEKLLAKHGEIVVTRRGKEIARVVPARQSIDFAAHEALRRSMRFQETPSEVLIGEDREAR